MNNLNFQHVLDAIKDNVLWVSNLTTIIFTFVATIVGLLTYQKAKKSLLEPIKSEVVKRQTKLLTELLEYISNSGGLNNGFDYREMISINTYDLLHEYGFVLTDNDKKIAMVKDLTGGITITITKGKVSFLEKEKPYSTQEEKAISEKEAKKLKYEKFKRLKSGKVEVDKILLTKKYLEFSDKIKILSENPFMPTEVSKLLKTVIDEARVNTRNNMKKSLHEFMLSYSKQYFKDSKVNYIVSPDGVYNIFNKMRISHAQHEEYIRKSIRTYMRVDEDWI